MTKIFTEGEHQALEADMQHLIAEIKNHQVKTEKRDLNERQVIKESLANLSERWRKEDASGSALPADRPAIDADERAKEEIQLQVDFLLDKAFHKGLLAADRETRNASSAVLDSYHDSLAAKLHAHLKGKGVFK